MLDGIRSNLERHGLDEDSAECQNAEPESIMFGSPATSSRLIETVIFKSLLKGNSLYEIYLNLLNAFMVLN